MNEPIASNCAFMSSEKRRVYVLPNGQVVSSKRENMLSKRVVKRLSWSLGRRRLAESSRHSLIETMKLPATTVAPWTMDS